MGVVAKQSFFNLISIGIGFLVGALNVLLLYPIYMGDSRQGLVVGLLALSNLFQPFLSMGLQHALIKFFSGFSLKSERDALLWFVVLSPLVLVLFLAVLYTATPQLLNRWVQFKATLDFPYLEFVLLVAVSTAYFEIFNSWLRVHLKSIFANFLKELYPRLLIAILIIGFSMEWYDFPQFIYLLLGGYYFRLVLIIGFSLWVYRPSWQWHLPPQAQKIVQYSLLIFLSGAAASFILDIDKAMLLTFSKEEVAYYSVAIYIAAVIEAPGRALFQIISPIVAEALNKKNNKQVQRLLQKSSTLLLVISGGLFLLIQLNVADFYNLIQPEYKAAMFAVQLVSLGKLYSMSTGCMNQIISNSDYYPYVLFFSVTAAVLAILLNMFAIPRYGLMGAAYATLAVLICINSLKVTLLWWKMKMQPYSMDSLQVIGAVVLTYLLATIITLPFSPVVNIVIQSMLIGGVYLLLLWGMGSLKQLTTFWKRN